MLLPFLLITLLLFVIGAVVGSFLNVIVYRTVNDESWIWGRSHCDHCQTKVSWYDNIPILSYIVLKARCRHCQEPIALSYPVVEVLTGTLFVWWYWGGSLFFQLTRAPFQTIQPFFWLVVGVLLLIIAVADALYYIIPDVIVGMLTLISLCYRIFLVTYGVMQLQDFILTMVAMLVAVAFIGSLWLLTRGRGMGFGDVKLMIPLALLLGWPKILVGMFAAFVLGATFGVVLLLLRRKKINQAIPFGPFLILGAVVGLVFGSDLFGWYVSLLM